MLLSGTVHFYGVLLMYLKYLIVVNKSNKMQQDVLLMMCEIVTRNM